MSFENGQPLSSSPLKQIVNLDQFTFKSRVEPPKPIPRDSLLADLQRIVAKNSRLQDHVKLCNKNLQTAYKRLEQTEAVNQVLSQKCISLQKKNEMMVKKMADHTRKGREEDDLRLRIRQLQAELISCRDQNEALKSKYTKKLKTDFMVRAGEIETKRKCEQLQNKLSELQTDKQIIKISGLFSSPAHTRRQMISSAQKQKDPERLKFTALKAELRRLQIQLQQKNGFETLLHMARACLSQSLSFRAVLPLVKNNRRKELQVFVEQNEGRLDKLRDIIGCHKN